jgi:hypothetical protein
MLVRRKDKERMLGLAPFKKFVMMLILAAFVCGAKYKSGDPVIAFSDVIGPSDNPIETFPYLSLPFCTGATLATAHKSFGDILLGHTLADVGLHFSFLENKDRSPLCTQNLTSDGSAALAKAISQHYWARFLVDDFPVWHPLGDGDSLYTSRHFTISYNRDSIVDVNVSCGDPAAVRAGAELSFTFSVSWEESRVQPNDRYRKFRDGWFFKNPIPNYAVLNSGLLLVLLVALVCILMCRIIGRDKEGVFDGFDLDTGSEKGWKALHSDVFRPPRRVALWSILAGSGAYFFFASAIYAALSHVDELFPRDGVVRRGLSVFVLTAPVAGFLAVTIGRAFGYQKWLRLAFGSVWPVPITFLAVYLVTSLAGCGQGVVRTFSMTAVALPLGIQICVVLPLAVVGAIVAIKLKLFEGAKREVAILPRYIPEYPWYLRQPALGCVIGGVCFCSVIIELYYVLTSLWQYAGLYVWSYFFAAVVLLAGIAGCATTLAVYWLLQSEVHHWQWASFTAPATTGLYVFAYSLFFFATKTKFVGTYQTLYYLMYMGELSIFVSLLAGGAGLLAANAFVHKIFTDLKLD